MTHWILVWPLAFFVFIAYCVVQFLGHTELASFLQLAGM